MPLFIIQPSQRGATSLENTVMIMVFLLLSLAAYESSHWLLLRQALNTALLDTARIAATQHAHRQIINEAFTEALQRLPAFSFNHDSERWKIQRLSTVTLEPTNSPHTNKIRHDYQAQQYRQGNTQTFADNTLYLRLHYLHKPVTPIVRQAIRSLLSFSEGPYQNAYAKGYIPMTTDVQVAMQSDHTKWISPSAAMVFNMSEHPSTTPGSPISAEDLVSDDIPAVNLPIKPWQPPSPAEPSTELSCETNQCCGPL